MASEIGQMTIGLKFDGKKLTASLDGVAATTEKAGGKLSKAWSTATALVNSATNRVFNGVVDTITSSVSTAIKRVDTLSNSQKVFEALGYSASDTTKNMNKLTGYLDGLPTSMTDAVGGVQRLAGSFGDLDNATDYFVAMNDAGLAFGATTDQVSNAITQLSQTSLDGPLDAATWNSLQDNGFGPVFSAMARDAGMTVGQLKEDFGGRGTKTVQDFLNELVKLDTEGSGAMKSLSEIAKENTNGIGTALENMGYRVGNALSKIMDQIGQENIANFINGVSSKIVELGQKLADVVKFFQENEWAVNLLKTALIALGVAMAGVKIANFTKKMINMGKSVADAFKKVSNASKSIKVKLDIFSAKDANKTAKKAGKGVDKVKTTMAQKVANIGTSIQSIASTIGTTLSTVMKQVGTILGSVVTAVMEPIKALFKGLGEAIAGFFTALASPQVAMGALMFAAVAASIAAAIFLIGSAIGAVMPVIQELFNTVIMPVSAFIASTVIMIIQSLTACIIDLTNNALIPLGTFMLISFVTVVNTVTDAIIRLTNEAIIPLINTLSGAFQDVLNTISGFINDTFFQAFDKIKNAIIEVTNQALIPLIDKLEGSFTNVLNTVSNIINTTLKTALDGIAKVVDKVGDGFTKMGGAIESALNGASAVLGTFADLLSGVASAIVAIVALATHQSVSYGVGFASVTAAATGGRVIGKGTETSDSNLYALSNGEYVIRAAAAKKIGYDNLDQLNANGQLNSFGSYRNNSLWNAIEAGTPDIEEDITQGPNTMITINQTNEVNNNLDIHKVSNTLLREMRISA